MDDLKAASVTPRPVQVVVMEENDAFASVVTQRKNAPLVPEPNERPGVTKPVVKNVPINADTNDSSEMQPVLLIPKKQASVDETEEVPHVSTHHRGTHHVPTLSTVLEVSEPTSSVYDGLIISDRMPRDKGPHVQDHQFQRSMQMEQLLMRIPSQR